MDDLANLLGSLTLDELKGNDDIDDLIGSFQKISISPEAPKVNRLKSLKKDLMKAFNGDSEKVKIISKMIIESEKERKLDELAKKVAASMGGEIYQVRAPIRKLKK